MSDLLKRKETEFVLWRPGVQDPTPRLVIGQLLPGTRHPLSENGDWTCAVRKKTPIYGQFPPPSAASLRERSIITGSRLATATLVAAPSSHGRESYAPTQQPSFSTGGCSRARVGPAYGEADRDPAGVVLAAPGDRLTEADPGGEVPDCPRCDSASLPPNNRLVIYDHRMVAHRANKDGRITQCRHFSRCPRASRKRSRGHSLCWSRCAGGWTGAPARTRRERAGAAAAGRQLCGPRMGLRDL